MNRLFLINIFCHAASCALLAGQTSPEEETLETSVELATRATASIVSGNCTNPPVQSDPCKNFGVCISAPSDSHTCNCKAGWGGPSCEADTGNVRGNTLFTDNGVSIWGTWDAIAQCNKGYFAIGFAVRFEEEQGSGDDSAVNQFKLICGPPDGTRSGLHTHTQGLDGWGEWTNDYYCPYNYYMVAFNQQVDPDSGKDSDDWGVAKYRFICRGPGLTGNKTSQIESNTGGQGWGEFSSSFSATCNVGDAICGFRARTVGFQGWAAWDDDAAIVDTEFYCCQFEHQATRYQLHNFQFYLDDAAFLNQTNPKVVSKATIENLSGGTITASKQLSATKSNSDSFGETLGLSTTVSTEATVGSDEANVKAGLSIEGSYTTEWGKTMTDEFTATLSVTVSIPPLTLGEISMVLLEGKTDVPYSADITTIYADGFPSDTRRIKGTWKRVRVYRVFASVPAGVNITSESVNEVPVPQ